MILDIARKHPDSIAVDDGNTQRSWSELVDRSTRIAQYLRENVGLEAEQHASILMQNSADYLEITLGAFLAGIWLTPINWHLAQEEIAYILDDSGSRVLFHDEHFAKLAETLDAKGRIHTETLHQVFETIPARPLNLDGIPGGTMIYTSGTTGRPKGVKRYRPSKLGDLLTTHAGVGRLLGLDGTGPHLITGPMYHAAPLLFAMYDQANGAPIHIMPKWDEFEALRLIDQHRIAHTHMVPTMFIRMLRLPQAIRQAFRPADLRLVLHGAAPVSIPVKQAMIEWLGPVLVEYWGATESGVNTLVDSNEWLRNPGTVGRALSSFELFTVDEEGTPLAPNETGALYCRHKTVEKVFEYHGDPEKTRAAYLEPGVFTIGDIGRVDADGYVYLADRKSHMIISGGVNIYPAEVEQALEQHPAVSDVGVFGIPNDEWGEEVKAAIELAVDFEGSDALAAEILADCKTRVANYKVPRSIDFVAKLPRHPSGKLYIRRLRDPYWVGHDRQI